MSEFWHKIGCCVVAKPPPRKKRRKIDCSMIGEPTNFVHLTHIGSGEMAEGRSRWTGNERRKCRNVGNCFSIHSPISRI
uniref:CDC42 small effector 1 n=1 Tax=Oncorhynchus mykiss TaxID=8022 RepID=A0A8K9UXQ5_ONCMY